MYELICAVCGQRFESSFRHTKGCSPECRRLYRNRQALIRQKKPKAPAKQELTEEQRQETRRELTAEINEARAAGLSYGELTALRRAGALYIRGERWVYDPVLGAVNITKDHLG